MTARENYAGNFPYMSTGIFPHEKNGETRDNARVENRAQQVAQRIDAMGHGLSDRYISLEATGKPDTIRDMRRGRMPSGEKLQAIADVLRTTVEHLLGNEEPPAAKPSPYRRPPATVAAPRMGFTHEPIRADVPVHGTALGADLQIHDDHPEPVLIEQTMLDETQEIARVRRLPGIEDRRDIYAVYVTGTSMEPRYYPRDIVYVDPHQPARGGDDVIVQLARPDENGEAKHVCALIKRFIRRTAKFVELEQFQPEVTFRVPIEDIRQVHRIIPLRELAGY